MTYFRNLRKLDTIALGNAIRLSAGLGKVDTGHEKASGKHDDLQSLFWAASEHSLLPALWAADCQDLEFDEKLKQQLHFNYILNAERNKRILVQTQQIAAALSEAGVKTVALKGIGHLISDLWRRPGARILGDVDILVPATKAGVAKELFHSTFMAHSVDNGPTKEWVERMQHLEPFVRPGWVAPVEIHTRVLKDHYRRLLSAEEVIKEATLTQLGQTTIWVPTPRHKALHAILHGFVGHRLYYSGGILGRDLVDLLHLKRVHGEEIDWSWIDRRLSAEGWSSIPRIVNFLMVTVIGEDPLFPEKDWRGSLDVWRWRTMLRRPQLQRFGEAYVALMDYSRMLTFGSESRGYVLNRISNHNNVIRVVRKILDSD